MNPEFLISYDDEVTATLLKQDLSASGIDCDIQKRQKQAPMMP